MSLVESNRYIEYWSVKKYFSEVEIVEQLQIGPGESKELSFNYDSSQIDYICKEHTMKDSERT